MTSLSNRTSMALFSDPLDHYSQRVRIVMCEKGVTSEIIDTDSKDLDDEILEVSPYAELPVLVDRDVCLYDSVILMEYLDERFPHPPLLPVYPVARAQTRLILHRFEADWCEPMDIIEDVASTKNEKNKNKKIIEKNLTNSLSLFNNQNFFRSDDLTVLDTVIMPILFRLPYFGIKIPSSNSAKALNEYIERMRDYKSFSESISESEKELLI